MKSSFNDIGRLREVGTNFLCIFLAGVFFVNGSMPLKNLDRSLRRKDRDQSLQSGRAWK